MIRTRTRIDTVQSCYDAVVIAIPNRQISLRVWPSLQRRQAIHRNIGFLHARRSIELSLDYQTSSEQHRFDAQPMRYMSYMSTAVFSVYTHQKRTHNHPDWDKRKRLAKRGWLLLCPAAGVHYFCCWAAFDIRLPRSLSWSVVLRSC